MPIVKSEYGVVFCFNDQLEGIEMLKHIGKKGIISIMRQKE